MKKIVGVVISIIVLGLLFWPGWFLYQQNQKPLSKDDIKDSIEQLESVSSEGSVLAGAASRGEVALDYKDVAAENLSDQQKKIQKKLTTSNILPEYRDLVREQISLNKDASALLSQLQTSSDLTGLQLIQKNLNDIYSRENSLEGSL